jgi:catechol 2,3-dioxygenase-like lactoylglutathione lyase family enzyme
VLAFFPNSRRRVGESPEQHIRDGKPPCRFRKCFRSSGDGSAGAGIRDGRDEHMTIQRMDHVAIVVDDLAAATEFFVQLGLELQGEGSVEGRWVDRVVGLEGVRVEYAMVQTPDGNGRLELVKFHSPSSKDDNRYAPANAPGIRHVAFAIEDIDAVVAGLRAHDAEFVGELENDEDIYRLCYVRGPDRKLMIVN